MKIKINISNLKKNKADEINDKIKLGYTLKEMSASLVKDTIVKQTWTKDQQTYLDGKFGNVNDRLSSLEKDMKEVLKILRRK